MRHVCRVASLALAVLAGCGDNGQRSSDAQQALALSLPDDTITLEAGQKQYVTLLTVGARDGSQVTFTGQLPAFARLDGSLLTLAPGRGDEGDYDLVIEAAVGDQSSSASLHVVVTVQNTAPALGMGLLGLGDANGIYTPGPWVIPSENCPGPTCVIGASPAVYVGACDAESDAMTVEVEVVQRGQAFSGNATHAFTGPAGTQSDRCGNYGAGCSCYKVPLDGLLAGQSYAFAVRVADALGATASPPWANPLDHGWLTQSYWYFSTAP